jgi:hypothetical protein
MKRRDAQLAATRGRSGEGASRRPKSRPASGRHTRTLAHAKVADLPGSNSRRMSVDLVRRGAYSRALRRPIAVASRLLTKEESLDLDNDEGRGF